MRTKNFILYMVKCIDKSLYIGITNDLQKRLRQHNGKIKGGSKYTRAKRPVSLVYSEDFPTKSEALKREYQLKKLSREEKIKLISIPT